MTESSTRDSSDTGPLEPSQLSKTELEIIHQIEQRLAVNKSEHPRDNGCESGTRAAPYLAVAEKRGPQVLLLDGSRGTGKTSLMLTLVERWHRTLKNTPTARTRREKLEDGYEAQEKAFELTSPTCGIPQNIKVLAVLDFDPLPPGVPLIAGIVEAWRPIAKYYDDQSGSASTDFSEEERLMDRWHALFGMAATGWAAVSQGKSLLEQVLDREEQVQDWQRMNHQWQEFVDKVLESEKRARTQPLHQEAVCVVMIDDVDLQVERIRELLPALRLLYHPNVFFLVAADREHMLDMLKLDFYGQQRRLAHKITSGHDNDTDESELMNWATVLATAAFEKVFPRAHCWALRKLSLKEILEFSPASREVGTPSSTIGSRLEELTWTRSDNGSSDSSDSSVTQAISSLSTAIEESSVEFPGLMTYRAAQHLWQFSAILPPGDRRAAEILASVVAGSGKSQRAMVKEKGARIELETTGILAALFRPGLNVAGGAYDIVFGRRVDFVFHLPNDRTGLRMSTAQNSQFNFAGSLIAKMLQEGKFPVDATGLSWDTYLSHVWTEWQFLDYSFAWPRHRHPKPQELLQNAETWNRFAYVGSQNNYKIEHYAFGWIYYQRLWNGHEFSPDFIDIESLPDIDSLPWKKLLDLSEIKDDSEKETWNKKTLPQLARPELGYPPKVQRLLLEMVANDIEARRRLKLDRESDFTNAFFAAEVQAGSIPREYPAEAKIKENIISLDKTYKRAFGDENPWAEIVEQVALT